MTYGKILAGLVAAVLCAGVAPAVSNDAVIQGDYVEARTCDVWTGPCFSNSEINLTGKNAVAGWAVTKGSWKGTALDGLKIVAALKSEGTLHTEHQGKVLSVLFVDEKASDAQANALVSLVKTLAPDHFAHVLKVEKRAIEFSRKGLEASLTAGTDVTLRTTALCPCDAICCNEEQAYPTVSASTKVDCVKTAAHEYRGKSLGDRWSDANRRSALVGTFAR